MRLLLDSFYLHLERTLAIPAMELLKYTTLLWCAYLALASEHTHIIPVEKYDTELQELGQHVEIPETPVRVIKITKTIAVKIPVPYPVKIVEKVPYPVHVSKPYPVPVPQIVKVPHVVNTGPKGKSGHEESPSYQGHNQFGGNPYHVQDQPSSDTLHGYSPTSEHVSYGDAGYSSGPQSVGDEHSLQGSDEAFVGGQFSGHYGYPGNDESANAFESNSYDQAIQNYLENHGSSNGASVPHY